MEEIKIDSILSKFTITTITIIFAFLCGTLYLLSFWSTFDFDITNYIEFFDIPKSFVFPIATGIGISFLLFIIQGISFYFDRIIEEEKANQPLLEKIKELPTKTLVYKILTSIDFFVFIVITISIIFYAPRREWVFGIAGITIIIYSYVKVFRNQDFASWFPNLMLRRGAAIVICIIPILSFLTGKFNSIAIWENRNIQKIEEIQFKDSSNSEVQFRSWKLIGKLGSFVFISDTLNHSVSTLNIENIKYIKYSYRIK